MGTGLNKALSWEIDNFSERIDVMKSDTFSSGGCEWFLGVYARDQLSMYLQDVNTHKLRSGWKRRVSFCLVLLNQSGKELYRSPDEGTCRVFCAETPSWGVRRTFPLTKLKEKGFLEKNKLTIEVYIKVFKVVHAGKSTENDVLDYNGLHIIASQAGPIRDIFVTLPDFVIPMNQGMKTAYMNLLGDLAKALRKCPRSAITELKEAGFKLDWLKSRLEEISLEEKVVSGGSWVKQLEDQVENVVLKVELDKDMIIPKNQGLVLERKQAMSDGPRVQQLEERIENVELTLSDLKVELDKERIKSAARVSAFGFADFLVKRFFLSCFSFSKY